MALKISKDELDRLGETTLSFRDGSGYLAEMGVFHELHCVVLLASTYRTNPNQETDVAIETASRALDRRLSQYDRI